MNTLKPYRKFRRLFILLCIGLSVSHAYAQDEEQFEEDSTSYRSSFQKGAQLVTLKHGYRLGDGITFTSPAGSLSISPTLRTVFSLNTTNDDLSRLHSGFAIERARLTMVANIFDRKLRLVTRLNLPANNQSATTGSRSFNTTLQEAYFEYRPGPDHSFNIGLRADYIDTRELRVQGENLGFLDRSAVSASFDGIFDYGVRYKGNLKLGGRHLLRPYVSITTGDSRASLQKNFGGFRYGIRLDYLPFDRFSRGGEYYMEDLYRESKPRLVIGVVWNYNDGASSAMGTNGGRWIYGDSYQATLLPKQTKWIVDYLFKYSGFYSMGSYVMTRATVPGGIAGEFRLNGSFIPYSSTQTPEQTDGLVRSRLNLGSGLNLQGGYVFASDVAAGVRYSSLKSDAASAAFAGYNRFYSLVVTKYISDHNLKVQAQFGFDELRKELKTPDSKGNYSAQIGATIQL